MPTDTDNLVMLRNMECPICMVNYAQMTKENLTYILFYIATMEGIISFQNNIDGINRKKYVVSK